VLAVGVVRAGALRGLWVVHKHAVEGAGRDAVRQHVTSVGRPNHTQVLDRTQVHAAHLRDEEKGVSDVHVRVC